MGRFGEFDAGEEFAGSRFVSLCYATRAGTSERFVVKARRPDDLMGDDDRPRQMLDAVRAIPESIRGEGGWVPVHAMGVDGDTAYWVTDDYPATCDRLIQLKRANSAADVVRVCVGVVESLIALRDVGGGRGHGNLKPANIMLSDPDPASARVLLSDAAGPSELAEGDRGATGDLRAVGRLIYELICLGDPPRGGSVATGTAWSDRGAAGERLRGLCEQLINMQPGSGPALEALRDALRAAEDAGETPGVAGGDGQGGTVGRKRGKAGLVITAVVLVAAAGALVVLKPWQKGNGGGGNGGGGGGGSASGGGDTPNVPKVPDPRKGLREELTTARKEAESRLAKVKEELSKLDGGPEKLAELNKDVEAAVGLVREIETAAPGDWQTPREPGQDVALYQAELVKPLKGALTAFKDLDSKFASAEQFVSEEKKSRDAEKGYKEEFKQKIAAARKDVIDQSIKSAGLVPVKNGIDKLWRDAIKTGTEDWDPPARAAAIKAWAEGAGEALNIALPGACDGLGAGAIEKLGKKLKERREAAAIELAKAAALDFGRGVALADSDSYKAEQTKQVNAVKAWIGQLEATAGALGEATKKLRDKLDRCAWADAPPMDGLLTTITKSAADLGVEDYETDLLRDAREIEAIAAASGADGLVSKITPTARPAVAIAAWQGLVAKGYPASLSEFAKVKPLSDGAMGLLTQVGAKDKPREAALRAQIGKDVRAMWFGFMAKAPAASAATERDLEAWFDAGFKALADFGLDEKQLASADAKPLSDEVRLSYELWRLRAEADKLRAEVEAKRVTDAAGAIQALFKSFADGTGPFAVRVSPNAATLVSDDRKWGPYKSGKYFDPAAAGPGLKGWTATRDPSGQDEWIRYAKGGQSLAFRRVQIANAADATYLCTTELTVGEFVAIASADWSVWRDGAQALLPWRGGADGQGNAGRVVVWDWTNADDGRQIVSTGQLLDRPDYQKSKGWVHFDATALESWVVYPPGTEPPPPDDRAPMNYIGAGGAAYLASAAGCRLPVVEEWQAALRLAEAGRPDNLRDQRFESQCNDTNRQVQASNGVLRSAVRPYARVAMPKDNKDATNGGCTAAVQSDDGVLFFRPVPSASSSGTPAFADLRGNVAEWVCVAKLDTNGVSAALTPQTARQAVLDSGPGKARVIGGSALSPASVVPTEPIVTDLGGFVDVGLRLAFTATGTSSGSGPAAALCKALSDEKFRSRPN